MIYGIGVDSVEIARMEKSVQSRHFVRRIFSAAERAIIEGISAPGNAAQSAAANFAAKEAFLKAAGKGLGGFGFEEISALRRESGAPYYALCGRALAFCEENGLTAHLSLTHDGGLATAFAVLEKR